MSKLTLIATILISLTSVASADTTLARGLALSRTSRDTYTSQDGSVAVRTRGCTQTAWAMSARIVEHRGDVYVVWYDVQGREESDCAVAMIVTRTEGK